jgi:uncharacterized protein (DUF427 family)
MARQHGLANNMNEKVLFEEVIMVKAVWRGVVLAESDKTIRVEGNHYFPPGSVNWAYFKQSESHTVCFWKGIASYYDVEVEGRVNKDAAWYYPDTKPLAKHIQGYVAFWHGVKVEAETPAAEAAPASEGAD